MTQVAPKLLATGSAIRGLSRAGLAAFFVLGLWALLRNLLAADRGLDLTDEGLYLLAADPPSLTAAWGTPAGWHTAPLFRAVGYDVADFRTLGALLLVIASAVLGFLAVALGQRVRHAGSDRSDRGERAVGALLGGLGGLLYYGGLVRTPSYNWVTVFGATLAAVGLLTIVTSRLAATASSREGGSVPLLADPRMMFLGVVVSGFGAFFTVPAKPTTPIFFAVLAVPLLRFGGDFRFVVRTVVAITGAAFAFLVAAVALGFWPVDFMRVFLAAVLGPSLLPQQGLAGALATVPTLPFDLLQDPRLAIAVVAVGTVIALQLLRGRSIVTRPTLTHPRATAGAALIVLLVFGAIYVAAPRLIGVVEALPLDGSGGIVMPSRDGHPVDGHVATVRQALRRVSPLVVGPSLGVLLLSTGRRARSVILLLTVLTLSGVNRQLLTLMLGGAVATQFGRPELTQGTLLVGLGVLLLAVARLPRRATAASRRRMIGSAPILASVAALWLVGVSTGFGSGAGLIRQASLAAGLTVAALLLGAAFLRDSANRVIAFVAVASLVLPATALQVTSNFRAPYRLEPISVQTVEVPVGVDGAQLRLDEQLAGLLVDLSGAAESAGWKADTPMLPVASRWSSTIPWHLGALVPESLMLTIGGYGAASTDRLEFSLEQAVDDRFTSAWILVSSERHSRRDESIAWARMAAASVGHSFPEDYVLVFAAENGGHRWVEDFGAVELWRPAGRTGAN